MGSKIIKIGLYVLLFIFLLLAGCILAIRTPYVQNLLVDRIASSLSEELGTEVSVENVGIWFPDYATLKGVLIKDFDGDSLMYLEQLKVSLDELDQDNQRIDIKKLIIEEPRVYFHRKPDAKLFNYVQILSKLQPDSTSAGGKPWTIGFDDLEINNGSFIFFDEARKEPTDRQFKETDIRLSNIELDATDFHIVGDSLHFDLASLTASEQSGIELKEMRSMVTIFPKGIYFDSLHLRTNNSTISDQFRMHTSNYQSYAYFIDSVEMEGRLDKSTVHGRDLAYFSDAVNDYASQQVTISTVMRGTLAKLKIKESSIDYGENTRIVAKGKIRGLPFWDETYLDFRFKELRSDYDDIAKLGVAELPSFLQQAGLIEYEGEFKGFHNDFVTYGSVVSDVGMLSSDLNFKVQPGAPAHYSGQIAGSDFDIGGLLNIEELGTTSFEFILEEGKGLSVDDFKTTFRGTVKDLYYDNYRYTNTSIEGIFNKLRFEGEVKINDPELVADIRGEVDYNKSTPHYNVSAKLSKANLEALGLDGSIQNVKASATAQFTGSGIIDFNGKFRVGEVEILREGETIPLKNLAIRSETIDTIQRMTLNSDFVDMKLEGVYDFNEWEASYSVFLHHLFPDYYPMPEQPPKEASYVMEMKFKNHPFLSSITGEQYDFGTGTLKGRYSSREQSLRVDGKLSHLAFQEYALEKWDFNIIKEPHQLLNLSMDIASFKENGEQLTHDIIFDAHILPNDAEFLFNFAYPDDDLALNSYGELKFRSDTIEAYFMESVLYLKGEKWDISDENKVIYESNGVHISHLNLINETSDLKIHGDITGSVNDKLNLKLDNFDLDNISQFVDGSSFGGKAFGNLELLRLTTEPFFYSDLLVEDLEYNDNYLGNLQLISQAKNDPLNLEVSALMRSGMVKDLEIEGTLDLHENRRTMDLTIKMDEVEASPLEEIFKGLASDFDGQISADLTAKGKFTEPKINGTVELKEMGLTVDYLKTRYKADGLINMSEDLISMSNIGLVDSKGASASLVGTIGHSYFDDFDFNLEFKDLTNFEVMNTTKKDNELFYGNAYVDGSMTVKGSLDDIYLNIFAKTRKGTDIFIPLVYEAGSSSVSYISFVDFKDTAQRNKKRQKIEGLTMNLTLDVTPDAKTELIFDEFVNDKITGRGTGRLKMSITSAGDFDMFGDYIIEEGDYPVSAFNTTPTRFILKKGGRIRWGGDPYEAKIDIEANIVENVNPNDLLALTEAEQEQASNEKIEVEVQLFLKGSLFSPDISFGLNVPSSGGSQTPTRFNAVLNSVRSDPDELNRQVFAIIIFGSFIPPTFADNSAVPSAGDEIINTVRNSVSGMISNQLSHWISQYDDSWSFSVNWDQGSINEREQFILEAKKYLLKERVAVEASYDVSGASGTNPYYAGATINVSERLKFKAFRRLANDPTLGNSNTVTTTGVGLLYRKQFDRFFRRKSKVKPGTAQSEVIDK